MIGSLGELGRLFCLRLRKAKREEVGVWQFNCWPFILLEGKSI